MIDDSLDSINFASTRRAYVYGTVVPAVRPAAEVTELYFIWRASTTTELWIQTNNNNARKL